MHTHKPVKKRKKGMLIVMIILVVIVLLAVFEFLFIRYNGTPVARPNISSQAQTVGTGAPLKYVILGDSTAVSQGGDYSQGYAEATAKYLAQHHTVTWSNLAVPGSRAVDVANKQVAAAAKLRPDIVLIAVGANDVIHLTSSGSVRASLQHTITVLQQANKNVKIIMTGAPDMGSIPRFPQPVRWFIGVRTTQINKVVVQLAQTNHATFAPIAQQTGAFFRAHPEMFASDKFHPTTQGYLQWIPVLDKAIDQALAH